MTTNNESSPRNLNELLTLETYQGMTDAEIDIIIDYKSDLKMRQQLARGEQQALTLQMEQMIMQSQSSCDMAMSVLQSIIGRNPILHCIGGDNE